MLKGKIYLIVAECKKGFVIYRKRRPVLQQAAFPFKMMKEKSISALSFHL